MIAIREIPVEQIEDFWKIHYDYLIQDEIITEEEDKEYFQSEEYRGTIKEHMMRERDRHHMVYFVENGNNVGAAQYNIYQTEEGKCFILDFWVFQEYRGNRMGYRCFEALEYYTREAGAQYYEINCEKENAHRFWQLNGFADAGVDEEGMPVMVKR